ncbi:hypothetical protein GCM10009828_076260 [Actinoplanes couchii]|uniref:Uncharacterized protein n=1 Tax=Actinoplanes couchii TaxID=403638 RepID=A0ABQ3WZG6_9ACTN|nr:hypothetical protein Aco03nite_000700 [Actinoplanes couchii]
MTRRRVKLVGWIAGIAAGLAITALGVLFLRSGLDASDKWASVLGIFLNVAGLALAFYSAMLTRRAARDTQDSDPGAAPSITGSGDLRDDAVSNSVHADRIEGSVVQARDVHGLSITHGPDPGRRLDQHDQPDASPDRNGR